MPTNYAVKREDARKRTVTEALAAITTETKYPEIILSDMTKNKLINWIVEETPFTNPYSEIKTAHCYNTGGGNMNDVITLKNGFIIRINDEAISISRNSEDDENGENLAFVYFNTEEGDHYNNIAGNK